MTSPPTEPGLPSDKLIPPLNAPGAPRTSPGIQPGVTGPVIAQYVIIFGTSGGMFVYAGTPGPGNGPVYWIANAVTDPYGNPLDQGIWAGQTGSIQVGIQASGGLAEIFFVPVGTFAADATAGMVQTGGVAILELFSAKDTNNPDPKSDRTGLFLWDHGSGNSAVFQAGYFDANGAFQQWLNGTFAGMILNGISSFTAVQPGTGTDSNHPFVGETWHTATLINSWAGSGGGVNGFFYRKTPDNEVEIVADIINTTVTGNSVCFTLPTGYRPLQGSQNFQAAWNDVVTSNSPSVPWVNVQSNGNVQITGIPVANKEIFFRIKVPLDAL